MRALIVTRFSDAKQIGNTSTEVQTSVCKNYCKEHGYTIVDQLDFEAQSAKATNTRRLSMLIDFCRKYKGKADVLVVYKLDRFARNVGSHHYLKTELLKLNISLVSATEAIDNSAAGKLTENMLAAIAQFDNDMKSERVTHSMKSILDKGIWPWKTPIGYMNVRTRQGKADVAQVDETCAHHVRYIFEQYGGGLQGVTEIAQTLQRKRIVDYTGKVIKFSVTTVHDILNNSFYMGMLDVKKWKQRYQGVHRTLVSATLWEQCQKRMYPPVYELKTRRHINTEFPLRDNLTCGFCKRKMTAAWVKGKAKRYPLYYCYHTDCENPGTKAIDRSVFENEFYHFLGNIIPEDRLRNDINARLVRRYKERRNEFENDASRLNKQLTHLMDKKQNIIDMGTEGTLDKEDLTEQLKKVKDEIALMKLALAECHEQEFEIELLIEYSNKFFTNLPVLWFDSPAEQKVKLQRTLFPEGIIYSYKDGFSNTKLRPYFKLINDVKECLYANVTPREFESRFAG